MGGGHPRDAYDDEVPEPATERMVIMSTSHGTRTDGTSISDEAVEAMADEAEHSV